MAAKGTDLAFVGDPFGDCDEAVCEYDCKTDSLDGDICGDVVDHLDMWGGICLLIKYSTVG